MHVTHFSYLGKNVSENYSTLLAFSTTSRAENTNMKWKPEPEVDFGAILAKNRMCVYYIPVAICDTKSTFGAVS